MVTVGLYGQGVVVKVEKIQSQYDPPRAIFQLRLEARELNSELEGDPGLPIKSVASVALVDLVDFARVLLVLSEAK